MRRSAQPGRAACARHGREQLRKVFHNIARQRPSRRPKGVRPRAGPPRGHACPVPGQRAGPRPGAGPAGSGLPSPVPAAERRRRASLGGRPRECLRARVHVSCADARRRHTRRARTCSLPEWSSSCTSTSSYSGDSGAAPPAALSSSSSESPTPAIWESLVPGQASSPLPNRFLLVRCSGERTICSPASRSTSWCARARRETAARACASAR